MAIKFKSLFLGCIFGLAAPLFAVEGSPTDPLANNGSNRTLDAQKRPLQAPGDKKYSVISELSGQVLIDGRTEFTQPVQFDRYLNFVNISTPSLTPSTGHSLLFSNSAGNQFIAKFSDGSTQILGSGSSSTGDITDVNAGFGLTGGGTTGSVTLAVDGSTILDSTTAANTYLTQSSATATYLQKSSATATYLQLSSATATYLNSNTASNTYLTLSSATATYAQPSFIAGTYLTQSSATATYLQQSSATATYLQQSSATATYLQLSSATATYAQPSFIAGTYLTQSSAAVTYANLIGTQTFSGTNVFTSTVNIKSVLVANGTSGASGQVLTSQGTAAPQWTTPSTFSNYVLQCVSTTSVAQTATTSTSFVNTSLQASITLAASASRVVILVSGVMQETNSARDVQATIARGGSNLSGTRGFSFHTGTTAFVPVSMVYIDSPGASGSQSYAVQIRISNGDTTANWGEGGLTMKHTMILCELAS